MSASTLPSLQAVAAIADVVGAEEVGAVGHLREVLELHAAQDHLGILSFFSAVLVFSRFSVSPSLVFLSFFRAPVFKGKSGKDERKRKKSCLFSFGFFIFFFLSLLRACRRAFHLYSQLLKRKTKDV